MISSLLFPSVCVTYVRPTCIASLINAATNGVDLFQLLGSDGVVRLLDLLGYSRYRESFVKAGIRASELLVLELNSEFSEIGITMSSLHFKSLMLQLNKVSQVSLGIV